MGLLDNLRDRLSGSFGGDYDDDEYYDDEYDDEDYDDEPTGSGLLGNTPRPEAESVAVYTRSGRPVTTNPPNRQPESPTRRDTSSRQSSYTPRARVRDDYDDGYDDFEPARSYASAGIPAFNTSGQLPPYVLRAEAYEDVQTVVRRVRTNQPVFLVLNDAPDDIAQRILDFCFGLAFGIGGEVQPTGGKTFLVVPEGIQVSDSELDRLRAEAR